MRKKFRALATLFILLISGFSGPVHATGSDFMLNNEKLRFGGGGQSSTTYSYVDSIANSGLLEQPFYKSSSGNWYKLTYSTYPLNLSIGSGTSGSNWSTATVNDITSLSNLTVDSSGTTSRTPLQAVSYGYGTLISTGTTTLFGSKTVSISNKFELGQNDSFVKITTTVENTSASSIDNLRIWVGTQDDWVGGSDGPTKKRGNLVDGVFTKLTNASDSSSAIEITSGSEGVLFYSTTSGTGTSIDDCCSFSNAYNVNPNNSPIELTGDGSYAITLPAGNLAAGASTSIVWFYAAGAIADLGDVARAVAAAGAPAAPTVEPGDSLVDVSWSEPSSTDPITGYKVRYSTDNGSTWTTSGELTTTLSNQQTGLTNGTQYIFQVAALTGTTPKTVGTWSASSNPVIPGGPTSPSISSVTGSNQKLTVAFSAPSQTGGFPITDYEYSTDNGSNWSSANTTTSPFVITGLTNGNTYQVKIRAKGSFAGVASSATSGTPIATVASAPVISSITTGSQTLSVIFTAPTDDGGSTITNYKYSTDGTNYFAFSPTQTSSPLSITKLSSDGTTLLSNGTSYPITIKAVNTTGDSTASNSVNGTPAEPVSSGGGSGSSAAPSATPTPTPTPTRTITTAPSTILSGPVKTSTKPNQVPSEPVVLIGGVPTTVKTNVINQTKLNVLSGQLNLELEVKPDQGGVKKTNSGSLQVDVKKGGTANIAGTGVKPLSTVQVFLPLQGTNAKEIARIPTTSSGTFSGDALFATQIKEAPLPIGKQVLQIVSQDSSGKQAVVEMTVNIAQPVPSPELSRLNNQLPEIAPGTSIATQAGLPVPVTVIAQEQDRQATVQGDGWTMSIKIPSNNGAVNKSTSGALIKLVQNKSAFVQGTGFMPGTRADVWLFSDPTLVGTVEIDENGNFSGQVAVNGKLVPVGEHTLQIQGVGEDGYVRAANLGVLVDVDPNPSPSYTTLILAITVGLLTAAFFIIFFKRRKKEEAKHAI